VFKGCKEEEGDNVIFTILLSVLFTGPAAQQTLSSPAPIVFFDIAAPKAEELQAFYADLFGWQPGIGGQLSIPITSPIPATIRRDPAEKRVYLGVENITAKLEQIKARGGTIDAPRFEVKGVAVLALFKDPAGNPMGLVELQNGKPKIP
jgi:predicted enzyme related to lactoylglutathione lyase